MDEVGPLAVVAVLALLLFFLFVILPDLQTTICPRIVGGPFGEIWFC